MLTKVDALKILTVLVDGNQSVYETVTRILAECLEIPLGEDNDYLVVKGQDITLHQYLLNLTQEGA